MVLHYNGSADEADAAAHRIAAAGGRCGVLQADLSDRQAADGLVPRCREQFGAPTLLVNNASSYLYDTAATLSAESWAANVRMNLDVPVFLSRAFAASSDLPGRSIVNMLDFKVANLNPDYFSYTVAKAGMASATRLLAMAFRGHVRVNAIAPGLTLISGKQTQDQFRRAWSMTPLGLGPTPAELAHAVGYLHATPSINGQILCLDGGASLQPRARDISVDPAALA